MRTFLALHRSAAWLGLALLLLAPAAGGAVPYDPLSVPASTASTADFEVRDGQREIPLRVYLPSGSGVHAVVLFSHGLGGSREGSSYLGRHWAGRGYAAVFLQHPGSDQSVWEDVPASERMDALKGAANARNFLRRVKDVSAVLDWLAARKGEAGHALRGRLDLERVGMSGHSFGAQTTQAVSGQVMLGRSMADPRIRAALVMSPSTPRRGDARAAFARVSIPWMLMTGTKDLAPIGGADMASRLGVYPALPPGGKYELVLDGAEHMVFTDRPGERNPNHHRAILALSTAFWDSYLGRSAAARAWLDGEGARSVLEPADRWQHK